MSTKNRGRTCLLTASYSEHYSYDSDEGKTLNTHHWKSEIPVEFHIMDVHQIKDWLR